MAGLPHAWIVLSVALALMAAEARADSTETPAGWGRIGRDPSETADAAKPQKLRLRILSYNIRGLPWPLRLNGEHAFDYIGEKLEERRKAGAAPDIVLLQEAFSERTEALIERAGYAHVVKGPRRSDLTQEERHRLRLARRPVKSAHGSRLRWKFANSGLYILSDFPIVSTKSQPFGGESCAGFDCLANKAVLHARIAVPDLPVPLDVVNTHMNSDFAAKASEKKKLLAFVRQTDMMKAFIEDVFSPETPAVIGGDFNATVDLEALGDLADRGTHALAAYAPRQTLRYPYLMNRIGAIDAGQYCLEQPGHCTVAEGTDPAMVWVDSKDRQILRDSERVRIRPVSVERNFAETPRGHALSDHLGYEVEYELSW